MGGKRSDQHNIDPGEAESSDYRSRREGRSADERISSEDKQQLASNPHDQPLVPEERVNPVLRDLRERKQAGKRQDEDTKSDDDRVDEASRESFPASDPPAQP